MIDTHAHLYLEAFDNDIEAVVERAKANGVKQVLLPNVDVDTIDRMMSLVDAYPNFFIPMMGIHPTSIDASFRDKLVIAEKWFEKDCFCAVGEIGIDLYWDKTFVSEQKEAFRMQINWAIDRDLPIVIHARDAFPEIFSVLREFKSSSIRGVFHSFTGGIQEVKQIKDLGLFYFGINGIVTFKNSHLSATLPEIGKELLLLETDAPYLAPTPYRGKRNESAYLKQICETMANSIGISFDELDAQTTKNAMNLFNVSE